MHELGYVYIMTNAHNTVLYCGATIDLFKRVSEHKNKTFHNSFTQRYNINKLVYYEVYTNATEAFEREKQLKAGSRKKKINLINSINPDWQDLFPKLPNEAVEELRKIRKHFK